MEHAEAVETMAAERYLLGEMTPEDRDAFEEHFFGCSVCAADVVDSSRVRAAIAADAPKALQLPPRPARMPWIAAAATTVILAGYPIAQNMALRQQLALARQPQVVDSVSVDGASRGGGGEPVMNHSASKAFTIDFDIPPQRGAQKYVVRLVDSAGSVHSSYGIAADSAAERQHLLCPAGSLPPGRYQLEVRAGPAESPVEAWSFVVR
ncbi:MAG TPA: zf-HC2 domain-containing protein [Thermoanaerobaculia bacterium]